mmetsp:Transcript_7433/g.13266  ORF Transcript_7433/g.13266 Transcript_7433/m.13266 type:complete len:461 (-) Transcript_7433:74-1456(-)
MGASWLENPDALRLQERQRRHYLDHCFRARTPKVRPLWCDEPPPRPQTPQVRRPASGAVLRRPKSAAAVISTGRKPRPDSAPSRAATAPVLAKKVEGPAEDAAENPLRMPLVPVTVLQVLETRALQKRLLAYSGMPDARASPVLQQQRQKLLQGLSRRAKKAPKKDAETDESPMVALYTASKHMDGISPAQAARMGQRFSDVQRTHSGMTLNMPLSPMAKRPSKEVVQDMGTFSFQLPSSSRRPSKAGGDSESGAPQSALKSTLKVSITGDIEIPQLPLPDTPTQPNMPALPGSPQDSDEQSDHTKQSSSSGSSETGKEYEDAFEKQSENSDVPARESATSEPRPEQQSPSNASQATIKAVDEEQESVYDDAFEKESEGSGRRDGDSLEAVDEAPQGSKQAELGGYNEATSIPPQSSTSESYDNDSNQFEREDVEDDDDDVQRTSFPPEGSLESVRSSLS